MNAFAQAHKMAKEIIQAGDNYAATFALCLKQVHKKVNPMQDVYDKMIADSQDYIARLEALKASGIKGYIVVTGSGRMPILFKNDNTVAVTNIENATRWNDVRIARAKGSIVRNGAGAQGHAVYVIDHIEWEIGQQQKLITDLKSAM